MILVSISDEAVEYIKNKGGRVIIFQGCLTGCCAGNVPSPMMEVGAPRRSDDNYDIFNESGVTVYLDKELASYSGTAKIALDRTLWWKSLSFSYMEE